MLTCTLYIHVNCIRMYIARATDAHAGWHEQRAGDDHLWITARRRIHATFVFAHSFPARVFDTRDDDKISIFTYLCKGLVCNKRFIGRAAEEREDKAL